jgi:predicted DNA-binding mobile mystery protein A
MSAEQLARRMGVTKRTLLSLEERERAGTATIATLRRAAKALNCDLVYSVHPRGSLEELVNEQARKAARQKLSRIRHTMALEAQEPEADATDREVEIYAQDIKDRLLPELWDV